MRRKAVFQNIDRVVVLLYLALMLMGWLNIYSAVYTENHPGIFDFSQRYGKQFLWIVAAMVIAVAVFTIDHRFFDFFAYPVYAFFVLLLILVLIAGKEINGAKSWFSIGGFQIQPAEFAKPAAALALAKYLSGFNVNVKNIKTLVAAGFIVLIPVALILLQPDTGSSLVFFSLLLPLYREGFSVALLLSILAMVVLFFLVLLVPNYIILFSCIGLAIIAWGIFNRSIKAMLKATGIYILNFGILYLLFRFFTDTPDLYKTGLLAMGLSVIIFLVFIYIYKLRKAFIIIVSALAAVLFAAGTDFGYHRVLSDYQQGRIEIMLGLKSDPKGAGYNVNQSKIAIGSGGFFGKGYLKGTQTKLNFVPEQSTDFIFCTVGEEWGFLGSTMVIGLFAALILRLIQLSERQKTRFARIYGYGVVSILFFHFFVNIAMTIGLFPVVGIPLPFFSYGGSSLWAFTMLLFIFLKQDVARLEYAG